MPKRRRETNWRVSVQFIFGDIQPAAMPGHLVEPEASYDGEGPVERKHRVERSLRVRVQMVAHQGDLRTFRIVSGGTALCEH